MVNFPAEAAKYHSEEFPQNWRSYPQIARETIEMGLEATHDQLSDADGKRGVVKRQVEKLFDNIDVLILPTMPIETPKRNQKNFSFGDLTLSRLEATVWNNSIFNQTGHPVVGLSVVPPRTDVYVGVQIVGSIGTDERLLEIAHNIERSLSPLEPYSNWRKTLFLMSGTGNLARVPAKLCETVEGHTTLASKSSTDPK